MGKLEFDEVRSITAWTLRSVANEVGFDFSRPEYAFCAKEDVPKLIAALQLYLDTGSVVKPPVFTTIRFGGDRGFGVKKQGKQVRGLKFDTDEDAQEVVDVLNRSKK